MRDYSEILADLDGWAKVQPEAAEAIRALLDRIDELEVSAAELEAREPVVRVEYQGELYGNNLTEEDWGRLEELPDGTPLYLRPPSERAVPEDKVDEIVTRLYRRFKEWSARGFGPDDVTWCEVKADVQAMLAAAPGAGGGE